MNPQKAAYAQKTEARTLGEVIDGADLFLGLSGPGVLKPEMVARMAPRPIIFALANPAPEILPDVARAVAPDAIIATGRSDYPNQVNNVLCFPFIFRGALDVGATQINARWNWPASRHRGAGARHHQRRGRGRLSGREDDLRGGLPDPQALRPAADRRVASAVARAAMETGVATRPMADLEAYRRQLDGSVFRSAMLMRPVFEAARTAARRIVFAEGEDERVLRAANAMMEETTDKPILIGRPEVVAARCERAGLPIRPGETSTS
jgi:malate dehydrogenase (oxaloacetate-decarboxylating)(NADP+)